jgi:hypothetical protein
MSDLILMVRLFIGIFYPKAVEPLQQDFRYSQCSTD